MFQFKECRELRGFTQNYVALSLGVKAPSVNGWEKGKSKPTLENLIALSELLNVSTDMLLGIKPASDLVTENHAVLPDESNRLLVLSNLLNEEGQSKLLDYADDLVQSGKYIKINSDGMVQESI